jgi:hypothetical protein
VKRTYYYSNNFNFNLEGVASVKVTQTARGEEHLISLLDGTFVRVVPGWVAESWFVPQAANVQRDTDGEQAR